MVFLLDRLPLLLLLFWFTVCKEQPMVTMETSSPPLHEASTITMSYEATRSSQEYPQYYLYHENHDDYYEDDPGPCFKDGVRQFSSWFLPTFYSFMFLLGLVGNTLVILVLLKYKRLKNVTNIYLFNLAISDLLLVGVLPFWSYFMADEWVFGDGLCKLSSCIYQPGFYSGILFISLMTIDRYLAVVHVVFALKTRTVSYSVIASIAIWFLAVIFSFPELIINTAVKEGDRMMCKPEYSKKHAGWRLFISLENNLLGLLLPLIIMLFCYTPIVRTLLSCRHGKKMKAVKMIMVVMTAFVALSCPFNIVFFLQSLVNAGIIGDCQTSKMLDYAFLATQTLGFLRCCFNPVIYFFMGPKFKKDIKRCFTNCCFTKFCQSCRCRYLLL